MHKLLPLVVVLAILAIAVPKVVNGIKSPDTSAAGMVQGKKTDVLAAVSENGNGKKYLGGSIDKLQKVEKSTKNTEVKSELNNVIEEEAQADSNIDASIKNMDGRPGFLKFVMGPDYKNAGQVRSEVVHLQNQIRKIDKLEEKSGASESGDLAATKETLQSELLAIETTLAQKLEGFSLFGWLSKLLSGFTAPSASPTPVGSPEASASASPIESAEPSGTPLETLLPSASPTASPTASP